jgi:hypothetical protein
MGIDPMHTVLVNRLHRQDADVASAVSRGRPEMRADTFVLWYDADAQASRRTAQAARVLIAEELAQLTGSLLALDICASQEPV